MRAALFSLFLIVVGCGGSSDSAANGCIALAGGGELAGVAHTVVQIQIEAKIIAIDPASFTDLGLDFPITTLVQNDTGGTLGGSSMQGHDVVADGGTVGGPGSVPYLVSDGFDGFLSIVNQNFVSPFNGQPTKVFPLLPFTGECLTVDNSVATAIQNFAGGANQAPLSPVDPGLVGDLCFDFPDATALANLLSQIGGDARNNIIGGPTIKVFDGQRSLITLQDMTPTLGDLTPPFLAAVQAVTPTPLGIFTGVTVDVKPTIVGNAVELEVRLGTQSLSFFRSVPAMVGGQQADVEIPVVAPSVTRGTVVVPDGQTIVLGDFLRQGQGATERGIPILGDVPLVGPLFRNHTNEMQNLIVVITPTIIPPQ